MLWEKIPLQVLEISLISRNYHVVSQTVVRAVARFVPAADIAVAALTYLRLRSHAHEFLAAWKVGNPEQPDTENGRSTTPTKS